MKMAIVGAGIMGLQLAYACRGLGYAISVYERLPEAAYRQSTGFAAAGMLAPYSELESADALIAELGSRSLELWPELIKELGPEIFFRQEGSLLVSHQRDLPHFEQLTARIAAQAPQGAWRWVEPRELERGWEAASSFPRGLYLPGEAQVDTRDVLSALLAALRASGVQLHFGQELRTLEPFRLETSQGAESFDLVCDCRGIGGAADLAQLRGVRGEAFLIEAPMVSLTRPLRLMHPRYAVYIVPRAHSLYYIGATSLETDSLDPVTVRSSLELLSAAFSLDKGFGEARVVEALRGVRPAFPHHKPEISVRPGLIRVNGLYRHGFLLSPLLAQQLRFFLEDRSAALISSLFYFV